MLQEDLAPPAGARRAAGGRCRAGREGGTLRWALVFLARLSVFYVRACRSRPRAPAGGGHPHRARGCVYVGLLCDCGAWPNRTCCPGVTANHDSRSVPEALKSEGNHAFVAKEYPRAVEIYTQAIALDAANHVRSHVFDQNSCVFTNHLASMCVPAAAVWQPLCSILFPGSV